MITFTDVSNGNRFSTVLGGKLSRIPVLFGRIFKCYMANILYICCILKTAGGGGGCEEDG